MTNEFWQNLARMWSYDMTEKDFADKENLRKVIDTSIGDIPGYMIDDDYDCDLDDW